MLVVRWGGRPAACAVPPGLSGWLGYGAAIDPLRDENIDFALLDAGGLAVVAFVALGLFHGLVVAAVGGRYARPPAVGRGALVAGRVAVALLEPAVLPGFVGSLAEILS